MESQPLLAKFTAAKDTRIVSDNGAKCMIFEAGQTLNVHRDLFSAAIAAGLVPEEPLNAVEYPQEATVDTRTREEIVEEGLIDACKTLIARGNPNDFTLVGQPRAASVKKLVDFHFTGRDVQRAFEQAMHEVEQYGNNSTEHSEPSSSDTE